MYTQVKALPGSSSPSHYIASSASVLSKTLPGSLPLPSSDSQDEDRSQINQHHSLKMMHHTVTKSYEPNTKNNVSRHIPEQRHSTSMTMSNFIPLQKGPSNIDALEQQITKVLKEFQEKQADRRMKLEQSLAKIKSTINKKQ